MYNKKISVIVPVFNVELYLEECIYSILHQSYTAFEIILVDDGSTDSSPQICEELARNNKNILVIHKKNGGLSSARNAGLEIATGDYIAFVDSDDVIHRDYLSKMLHVALESDSDLVACDFIKGEHVGCLELNQDKVLPIEFRTGNAILDEMNKRDVQVTVAWNKLYDCKFFKEYNLRFPEGRIHEDMYLTPQVLSHTKKMAILDDKLYFYRQRPGSIISRKLSISNFDVFDAIEFRIRFFEKINKEKLVVNEIESYIRKYCSFRQELKGNTNYRDEMDNIRIRIHKIVGVHIFLKIGLKYKLQYGVFILLGL